MSTYFRPGFSLSMSKQDPLSFATTALVRDACLCLQVQRAARALARRFDAEFRPLGLTSGQFSLLMSLNQPKPPTLGQVATILAMDRTTLTANLKPLVQRGLAQVVVDEADRRSRRLVLTKDGRATLETALPVWRRTTAELARLLGTGGAERLCTDLQVLS
jgi:DNA-binding MarR family transcriptional regulator